jgi:hypothetical protein
MEETNTDALQELPETSITRQLRVFGAPGPDRNSLKGDLSTPEGAEL